MENNKQNNILYYTSLLFSIWFLLTSWFWTYLANLFISFPFGLLALLIYLRAKKTDSNTDRYKKTGLILLIGALMSVGALVGFLTTNS